MIRSFCSEGRLVCQNAAGCFGNGEVCVAEAKDNGLVGSVENLLAEKEAVAAKEKKLIENLNAVLGKMGYRVVSTGAGHSGAGTGKKVGRPPGSGKGQPRKGQAAP